MADILVDYASPVELTTLTGLSTLPGGTVTTAGLRVLAYGDTDTNVGIWEVVSGGPWTRATDFDTSAEVVFNQQIVPQNDDGSNGIQAGSVFYVATTGTITPGTTAFSIVQRTYEKVQTAGVGLVNVDGDWQQSTTGVLAGSYDRLTVDERGNATAGSSSETATTFSEGLDLEWLTATSFRVKEGAAYVNGVGSIVDLAVDTDVSAGTKGLPATFVANTWYYVYLYSNGGQGDVIVSTTAPATTPYRGRAREHSTDNTRRLIDAVFAPTTTTLRRFQDMPGGFRKWVVDIDSTTRIVDTGTNPATVAEVSLANYVPIHAEGVFLYALFANGTNTTSFYISAADDGFLPTIGATNPSQAQMVVGPNASGNAPRFSGSGIVALGASKALRYAQGAGSGTLNQIDLLGYYSGR